MNRKVAGISVSLLLMGAVAVMAQMGPGGFNSNRTNEMQNGQVPGQMQQFGRQQFDHHGQLDRHGQLDPGRRGGHPGMIGFGMEKGEEVELSGILQIAEDEQPVLRVGTKEYILFIPPVLAAEIEVDNGARVQIEGLSVELPDMDLTGTDTLVHVRVIQVGNTRYVIPGPRW